jgi:hypothetical protein
MENNVKNLNAFLKARKVTVTSAQKKAIREYVKECSTLTESAESTVKPPCKPKSKPFNLEKVLKGAPVVTRDGRKVTEIYCFKTTESTYTVYACIDGKVYPYVQNGKYFDSPIESENDLFMSSPNIEVWINLYYYEDVLTPSRCFRTFEEALAGVTNTKLYVKTIKIDNLPE